MASFSGRAAEGGARRIVARRRVYTKHGDSPIRGLLGHSSVKMTEKYAHLSEGSGSAYLHLLSAAAPENRGNQLATEVVRPS